MRTAEPEYALQALNLVVQKQSVIHCYVPYIHRPEAMPSHSNHEIREHDTNS